MSFMRAIISGALRGRRKVQAIGEDGAPHQQRERAKSIEERIVERGLADLARRQPEATRWFVMTDAERKEEQARKAAQ
jgi:hypothetical protein